MSEKMEFTGERFVPQVHGNIELEHMHRYLMACELATGKDVLDIASGEGYGSARLAQSAKHVYGVDISVESIKHAKSCYPLDNVSFLAGSCDCIPLPDHCVDLIISFETIEHHDKHEEMMVEIKRVLRPGGALLISSPDKQVYSIEANHHNPFHVKELFIDEFKDLLSRHFSNSTYYGQKITYGSAILEETGSSSQKCYWDHESQIFGKSGIRKPVYLLALASDGELPALSSGIYERPESESSFAAYLHSVIAEQDAQIAGRDAKIEVFNQLEKELGRERDAIHNMLREREGQLATLQDTVAERDGQLATLQHTVAARDGQLVTLQHIVAERDGRLVTLQHTVAERDGQLVTLQHTVAERDGQLITLTQSVAGQDRHMAILQHAITKCDELKIKAEVGRSEAEIALDKEKKHRVAEVLAREQLVHHVIKYSVKSRLVAMLPLLFLRRAKIRREVRSMKRGKTFDRSFYESQLPEGVRIHQPVVHYVVVGRKLGLKPHPKPPSKKKGQIVLQPQVAKRPSRVIFFSGEPHTPGHSYRVGMYAEAASSNGYDVRIIGPSDIANAVPEVAGVKILVIWRAAWDENIAAMVSAARCAGARIVFDLDDLMFDPSLAKCELVDGIRTQGLNELDIAAFYGRIGETMRAADFCTCSTQPLATAMRLSHKSTMVLPNGFDKERYQRSRRAVEARRAEKADGWIRIGYAGGSKTHQKDFAQAVSAVARILLENPKCLLVLFRAASDTGYVPYVATEEFPQLHGLEDQIEWREIVPLQQLPDELARFDINLAPLETDNPYCEAKSELKYFEAALVAVPTVASPTRPYAEAIRHAETGFLASSENEWYQALSRLVREPDFRRKMADLAFMDILWRYGPERRAELGRVLFDQIVGSSQDAATSFSLELRREHVAKIPPVETSEYEIIVEFGKRGGSEVAVIIPLYNYARFIVEALDSVAVQTLACKDLIVIDDCSTDDSLMVAREWIKQNHRHFGSIALLKNRVNSGLALTRNAGFSFADASFVMPLDADNMLEPKCLARCLEQITETGAATVYPTIHMFGDATGTLGSDIWQPARFAGGNYVDAMALIRKSAWAAVGGYRPMQVMGWEDFEFWCNFVENGLWGVWVPGAQAYYRVHGGSMIQSVKESQNRRRQMVQEILAKHPWLDHSCLTDRW